MASNKYWQNRMDNAQKLTDKQVTKKMKKLYQKANKNINKEITNIWMEMLEDGEISTANLYSGMRFANLQNIIKKELLNIRAMNEKYLSSTLIKVVKQGENDINTFIKKPIDLTITNPTNAKQIVEKGYKGAVYSERIWNNTTKLKGIIENKIIDSTILGKDVRKVSRELQKVMGSGYSQSKRICVTETSRVFNESCRHKAMENGYNTYHLSLEPDACDECKELEGEHFDINESVIPVHPNCKCTMIIDLPEL